MRIPKENVGAMAARLAAGGALLQEAAAEAPWALVDFVVEPTRRAGPEAGETRNAPAGDAIRQARRMHKKESIVALEGLEPPAVAMHPAIKILVLPSDKRRQQQSQQIENLPISTLQQRFCARLPRAS
jgi:hypothetical protein